MLFKTYELHPPYSPVYSRSPNFFFGQSINPGSLGKSYSIVIGAKEVTNPITVRIERAVREAWESLFDPQGWESTRDRKLFAPPYGLAIVRDYSPPVGEPEPPPFDGLGFYIVFALLETKEGSAVNEHEERATHESIWQAITAQYSHTEPKPRIALVTLYNCSVQVLEGPGPTDVIEQMGPRFLPRGRGFGR